jgi:WD40 repeat protein
MLNKSCISLLVILLIATTYRIDTTQARLLYRQVAFIRLPHPFAISWKPDGTGLAIISYPSIWYWDAVSQKLTSLISDAQVSDIAWSPDGNKIASVRGGEDETLLIWEASTGALVKQITRVAPDRAYIYRLAWSPDSRSIVSDGTGIYLLMVKPDKGHA